MTFALLGPIYLLVVSWPLAATDLREYRLPNRLVLPSIPISIVGQVLAVALGESAGLMLRAVICALLVFGIGLLANLRGLIGMGDVKLLGVIALALGWFGPLYAALAIGYAFGLAGVGILALVSVGRITWNSRVPLGPYLLGGFAVALGQWLFTAVV
jgi:leader peptidase (prepilin peptidase)/N-methyltransferase